MTPERAAELRDEIAHRRAISAEGAPGLTLDELEDLLDRAGLAPRATSGYAVLLHELHPPRPRNSAEIEWQDTWDHFDRQPRTSVTL